MSSVDQFFVADRDVGSVAGSASLAATQMSAGTLVGTVGIHYATGISFLAVWPGIWLGWLVSMFYIAPQLRRFGGVTVPEFLAARFDGDGADGRRTQAIVAVLIAGIYLVYTAGQYVAGAVVLETVLGVPTVPGMAALVVLVLGYTTLGGMRASIISDSVQVGLMIVGLAVAVGAGLNEVGGIAALHTQVRTIDPSLLGFGLSPIDIAGFAMAFGLGMAVAPYEVSRVYAMSDPETVKTAIQGSILIQAVVGAGVATLGLIARVTFPSLSTPDAAVGTIAQSLLGPVAGILLLLAVLAAVLSTLDSVLLVTSSALAYDLYGSVIRPSRGIDLPGGFDDDVMVVARAATVAAAVVPLLLATRPELLGGLVQFIVALYASLIAGALFAPVLLGLHWEGATTGGGLAGVLAGTGSVLAWHLLTNVSSLVPPPLLAIPPVTVGILVSAVAIVLCSVGPQIAGLGIGGSEA